MTNLEKMREFCRQPDNTEREAMSACLVDYRERTDG